MQARSSVYTRVSLFLLLAGSLAACKSSSKTSAGAAPALNVSPTALQARAKAPPPPSATKATSIGKGSAAINTGNSPTDTDSYWVEEIDIDGDGTLERTEMLWDDEDKVLFAYSETDAPCANGGIAVVQLLAGVNGAGNSRGRAAGSGFYAAYFDASECNAAAAGLYGCKFNASGTVTEWAGVVVDAAGDEVDFVGAAN